MLPRMRRGVDYHVFAVRDDVFNHNHAVVRRFYHAARVDVFELVLFKGYGVEFARFHGVFGAHRDSVHCRRVIARIARFCEHGFRRYPARGVDGFDFLFPDRFHKRQIRFQRFVQTFIFDINVSHNSSGMTLSGASL